MRTPQCSDAIISNERLPKRQLYYQEKATVFRLYRYINEYLDYTQQRT